MSDNDISLFCEENQDSSASSSTEVKKKNAKQTTLDTFVSKHTSDSTSTVLDQPANLQYLVSELLYIVDISMETKTVGSCFYSDYIYSYIC